jgi:heme exporter protein D
MKEFAFLVTGLVLGGLMARTVAQRQNLERELERERGRSSR